jgi:hypothetical protein
MHKELDYQTSMGAERAIPFGQKGSVEHERNNVENLADNASPAVRYWGPSLLTVAGASYLAWLTHSEAVRGFTENLHRLFVKFSVGLHFHL